MWVGQLSISLDISAGLHHPASAIVKRLLSNWEEFLFRGAFQSRLCHRLSDQRDKINENVLLGHETSRTGGQHSLLDRIVIPNRHANNGDLWRQSFETFCHSQAIEAGEVHVRDDHLGPE